jgi:hypothetical protein
MRTRWVGDMCVRVRPAAARAAAKAGGAGPVRRQDSDDSFLSSQSLRDELEALRQESEANRQQMEAMR